MTRSVREIDELLCSPGDRFEIARAHLAARRALPAWRDRQAAEAGAPRLVRVALNDTGADRPRNRSHEGRFGVQAELGERARHHRLPVADPDAAAGRVADAHDGVADLVHAPCRGGLGAVGDALA